MEIIDIVFLIIGIGAFIFSIIAITLAIFLPGQKCKCNWGNDNNNTYWSYIRSKIQVENQTGKQNIKLDGSKTGTFMTEPTVFNVQVDGIKYTGNTQTFLIEGYVLQTNAPLNSELQIQINGETIVFYTTLFNGITIVSGYASVTQNSIISLYSTGNFTPSVGSYLSITSTNGLIPQNFINPL